jgi:MFS family permease
LSSPPLGHLVDRFGRRAQIAVVSSTLLFGVHLTLSL